jgi:phospholipase C
MAPAQLQLRSPDAVAHFILARMTQLLRFRAHSSFLAGLIVAGALCSCAKKDLATAPGDAAGASAATTRALQSKVDTIVVIYAENRAFDNLYGNFPGARNLSEVIDRSGKPLPSYEPQKDRNGSVLPVLPPTWGGVTEAGVAPAVTQQQSVGLPNAPYSIEHAFTAQSQVTLSSNTVTRDLWHRFY